MRIYTRVPVAERFWRHVSPEPNSGCWLWEGGLTKGYGVIGTGGRNGRNIYATHVSLVLHGRPRPGPDMIACHRCDVRACVNPEHLYWGSYSENIQDSYERTGRISPVVLHDMRGERAPSAKLTDAQRLKIITSRAPIAKLAERYGVSVGTIHTIRNGDEGSARSRAMTLTARQVREACFADWVA